MKRAGNLYERIADPENLRVAFLKSIRGKRGKAEVVACSTNLDANLSLLREQLLAEQVDVGHYHFFTVHDPKEREICAASFPERVLHHAIMNVCEPEWVSGTWPEADLARHMEALLSYVRFANTLALRRQIVNRFSIAA